MYDAVTVEVFQCLHYLSCVVTACHVTQWAKPKVGGGEERN